MATQLAISFCVVPAAFRESFDQSLHDESCIVLVAEEGSSLLGYLLGFDHFAFFANGRVSGVEEVFVVAQHRRQGIGKALMRDFEEWAESRSSAQVVVCTRRAGEFYSALGYEETATCFRSVLKSEA